MITTLIGRIRSVAGRVFPGRRHYAELTQLRASMHSQATALAENLERLNKASVATNESIGAALQSMTQLNQETAAINRSLAAINQSVAAMNQRLAEGEAQAAMRRHEIIESDLRLRELMWRCTFSKQVEIDAFGAVRPPLAGFNMSDTLRRLQQKYRDTYAIWERLCENGERAYRDDPGGNLSSIENKHPMAQLFKAFALPHMHGRVLDVGCGPLPVPFYLEGYPFELIAGVDPFGEPDMHPFRFVRAVAEELPWPDGSFETIINSGSLDHLLDLEAGIAEHARVLAADGELIMAVYFVPGAKPYDPRFPEEVDQFHLFHFDKAWFEDLMARHFALIERLNCDGYTHFYRYRKRGTLPCTQRAPAQSI